MKLNDKTVSLPGKSTIQNTKSLPMEVCKNIIGKNAFLYCRCVPQIVIFIHNQCGQLCHKTVAEIRSKQQKNAKSLTKPGTEILHIADNSLQTVHLNNKKPTSHLIVLQRVSTVARQCQTLQDVTNMTSRRHFVVSTRKNSQLVQRT